MSSNRRHITRYGDDDNNDNANANANDNFKKSIPPLMKLLIVLRTLYSIICKIEFDQEKATDRESREREQREQREREIETQAEIN
jgi:hypothetical protein